MAAGRFGVVGLIMYAISKWINKESFNIEVLKYGFISGTALFFIGNGAVILSEKYLPSGLVSVLAALVPFWMLLFDSKMRSGRFKNVMTLAGLGLGFGGVILLFIDKLSAARLNTASLWAYGLMILGTWAWSYGTLYSKYHPVHGSTYLKASAQTLAAGLLFILVSWISGELTSFHFGQVSHTSWLALWYLILFGSMIGYFSYLWLIGHVSASAISTYAFVNPLVAVMLGILLAGEKFELKEVFALVFIIGGLVVLYFSKRNPK